MHWCVVLSLSEPKWFFPSTDWHILSWWSVFSPWYIASTVSISKNKKQYCTYIWNVLYCNVYITICSNKNMKVTFFWNVMPFGLVDRYWHFEETFCLNLTLCLVDEGSRLLSKRGYVSIKLLGHTPEDHNLHLLSSGCPTEWPWIHLHTGQWLNYQPHFLVYVPNCCLLHQNKVDITSMNSLFFCAGQ